MNLNLHSKEVQQMAAQYNTDRYTAMARIAGNDYGITPEEFPHYMAAFHRYMANRMGVLDSITSALNEVILNMGFLDDAKAKASSPDPLQSVYHYSLN